MNNAGIHGLNMSSHICDLPHDLPHDLFRGSSILSMDSFSDDRSSASSS
ncbi:3424_t:CDS:2 [Diversispora eburnea]|uniref:3424_t:CDS:1 n=1 Tax=Diversispora eburnea TaxID=1213867 RepID=A0A9N9FA87_9GLOM|nr:3424_t:CDS:2 [Diversispora eburnea]